MRRIILIFAILAAPLAAQATPAGGSISGDVYLMTRAGDVRRGAANMVYLLKNPTGIAAKYGALCSVQRERFRSENDADSAQLARTKDRSIRLALLDLQMKQLIARALRDADEQRQLVKSLAWRESATGMNAHYIFPALPPGEYILFATMSVGDETRDWLLPVTVTSGQEVGKDLDVTNVHAPMWNCDQPPPIN